MKTDDEIFNRAEKAGDLQEDEYLSQGIMQTLIFLIAGCAIVAAGASCGIYFVIMRMIQ